MAAMLGKQGISRTRRRFRGVATAMRRAMRSVPQIYDEALVPCGLGSTQRSVLDSIARAGRPTMGELAASLVLDRSALAYNIKPLE
jgi:DNA-binding MarR family transcriptional regulator